MQVHYHCVHTRLLLSIQPLVLTSRKQADVDAPHHTGDAAEQVPCLNALDKGEIHEADERPKLPASQHHGPKVPATARSNVGSPVDAAPVNGQGSSCTGTARYGALQSSHEGQEQQRVGGGADRLVEERLDGRVTDVELWLL